MNLQQLSHPVTAASHAFLAAVTISALLLGGFLVAEPQISHGQVDTDEFTITQYITDETSFSVLPTDVIMTGSINGVTGGQATGTTDFQVQSNNATGYYVEIRFDNDIGTEAMLGTSTQSQAIRDYDGDVAGEPSWAFTASTAAQFGYTVTSDTPTDTDGSFLYTGTTCDTGTTQAVNNCWKEPTTTGFRIVDRATAAPSGATSTINFRVNVPSNAVPVPSAENYIATATLSLFVQ